MKNLFALLAILLILAKAGAQCTYSCSSYIVSPINYSMYPAAGNTLSLMDDEVTTTLPLGFNFEFYCTLYNQVRICSNGFITFDFSNISFASTPYGQSLPSSTTPDAVIAWNWNDLDPSQGGSVTYTTIGTSPNQKFIVTYSAVPLWTASNPPSNLLNTGQIVLHESTNIIEMHIGEATNNGWHPHTQGIESAGATTAAVVPGRNLSLWTASLSSHMFSPFFIAASPQINGDTVVCEGASAHFSATTMPNAQGYYWSYPPGWTGSGSMPTHSAIAGASGNVSVAAIYTCGNSPPAVLPVNVHPAPVVSVAAAPATLFCSGTPFTLTPSGAATYTVHPSNVSGAGPFFLYPGDTTSYFLTGTDNMGCESINTVTTAAFVKPSPTIAVNSGSVCLGNTFTMQPTGSDNYSFSSVFYVTTPTTTGIHTYTVTSTGTNQCVSQPAISTVTVAPLPVISVSPDRPYMCANQTTTLTASGATTYTWHTLGNVSHTVAVSPPISFFYKVTGTDDNGCVGSADFMVEVRTCVGLSETDKDATKVYPNPSNGLFYVRLSGGGDFILYDMLGKSIFSRFLPSGENELNLAHLTPGVYFLIRSGEVAERIVLLIR